MFILFDCKSMRLILLDCGNKSNTKVHLIKGVNSNSSHCFIHRSAFKKTLSFSRNVLIESICSLLSKLYKITKFHIAQQITWLITSILGPSFRQVLKKMAALGASASIIPFLAVRKWAVFGRTSTKEAPRNFGSQHKGFHSPKLSFGLVLASCEWIFSSLH